MKAISRKSPDPKSGTMSDDVSSGRPALHPSPSRQPGTPPPRSPPLRLATAAPTGTLLAAYNSVKGNGLMRPPATQPVYSIHQKSTSCSGPPAVFADCPQGCQCDTDTVTVTCSGLHLLTLPDTIPSGFEVLVIRNTSIRSIPKQAFRRMDRLREIYVENCDHLTFLEKFAFKGMKKL
ncbi:leucine rich repeat domain protein, partial [Ostertagia ostertagi]